jgi:HprK-related kinase A
VQVFHLSPPDLTARFRGPGVFLRTGPFVVQVCTDIDRVVRGIRTLYAEFPLAESTDFADFHISFVAPHSVRRWVYPQICFRFDGESPFKPLPLEQACAMFEWCLNWCISSCVNQYLIIHAAAVERDGCAAILPGPPGSGKSTLCAALVNRGWRLLTDELTLISLETNCIIALARPIGLKNNSIEVIRKLVRDAVFGPECQDTLKGTVAHLRPPTQSVLRVNEPATPAWVVFPKYSAGQAALARPVSKAQALMRCAGSAFNYTTLGAKGFEVLSTMINDADCYDFEYGVLSEAIDWFDNLKRSVGLTNGTLTALP